MIRVDVKRVGERAEVSITGHAGYAPAGSDIVCAGVSSLFYALANELFCLEEQQGGCHGVTVENKEGMGKIGAHIRGGSKAEGALEMFLSGIELMAHEYGDYISISAHTR